MANPYINVYMNNPTAGGTDGTAVSIDGDNTAPITFTLDASQNESKTQTLAIRTGTGYTTSGDTVISDSGDTNDRWKLSLDGTNWADSITITTAITATNTIFYVKASAADTESPQTDRSVKINVQTTITAV